jgi:hypothetical protein
VKEVLPYLQSLSAIAFFMLGVATVVVWLRHRDRSLLLLGMATKDPSRLSKATTHRSDHIEVVGLIAIARSQPARVDQ